jgi:hypothetical protein
MTGLYWKGQALVDEMTEAPERDLPIPVKAFSPSVATSLTSRGRLPSLVTLTRQDSFALTRETRMIRCAGFMLNCMYCSRSRRETCYIERGIVMSSAIKIS